MTITILLFDSGDILYKQMSFYILANACVVKREWCRKAIHNEVLQCNLNICKFPNWTWKWDLCYYWVVCGLNGTDATLLFQLPGLSKHGSDR